MRTRKPTEKDVRRWIKQGYGQGEDKNYRPFFHVRDVPSRGRSRRVLGLKTGREHQYLSDVEYFHHVFLEFHPLVIGICEQYALLQWEETQEIADMLGVRHPIYRGTTTPIVMTSDFFIKLRNPDRICVVSVKSSEDLHPDKERNKSGQREYERMKEKLAIEKEYWRRREVPWTVSTEQDLPLTMVKNLDDFRQTVVAREHDWLTPLLPKFIRAFEHVWAPSLTFSEILDELAPVLGVSRDQVYVLFGRAVWIRLLELDLDGFEFHYSQPVKLNGISGGEICCQSML